MRFGEGEDGIALALFAIAATVLLIFASLAFDYAYLYMLKAKLQAGADAAALAAVKELPNESQMLATAITYAEKNLDRAEHGQLALPADVEAGVWVSDANPPFFDTAAPRKDAVRVVLRRATSNGNPVRLLLAPLVLGRSTQDLAVEAVAVLPPSCDQSQAIIGADRVSLSGDSYTDSYSLNHISLGERGDVCTNGDAVSGAGTRILGTAHYGQGHNVLGPGSVKAREQLLKPLRLPPVRIASESDNGILPDSANGQPVVDPANNSFRLESGDTADLPPGTYIFKDFVVGSGATVRISGQTHIYLTGSFYASGTSVINRTGNPNNLFIAAQGPNFTVSGESRLWAIVYAPNAHFRCSETSELFGVVAASKVVMSGHCGIHLSEDVRHPIPEFRNIARLVQ